MNKFTYYPGCSLKGTAVDYARSIAGICRVLGIGLEEIPDWTCCGSTAAHSIDHQTGISLAARNLNQASRMPHSRMLVPCPLCFNRLKTAVHALRGDQGHRYGIELSKSLPTISDLANFFSDDSQLQAVAEKIQKPLKGLKLVCYYGCMANRPPEVTGAADFEDPQALDRIITNLGATAVPWPYKTDCCGASQAFSLPEIESRLVGRLLAMARLVGARGIVVSCQMCQANLDMYPERSGQGKSQALPVFYFSELIGMALGLKEVKKWLKGHLVDPRPLLEELGL